MTQFQGGKYGGSSSTSFWKPERGYVRRVRFSPGPAHLMRFDIEAEDEHGNTMTFTNVANAARLDPSCDYIGPKPDDDVDIYWRGDVPRFVIPCFVKTTDCGGGT